MKRVFLVCFALVFCLAAGVLTAEPVNGGDDDREVTITLVRWPYT